jgi:hypothetical protein
MIKLLGDLPLFYVKKDVNFNYQKIKQNDSFLG